MKIRVICETTEQALEVASSLHGPSVPVGQESPGPAVYWRTSSDGSIVIERD